MPCAASASTWAALVSPIVSGRCPPRRASEKPSPIAVLLDALAIKICWTP
nr:hypothetical protein [Sphingopyxis sp. PET50]